MDENKILREVFGNPMPPTKLKEVKLETFACEGCCLEDADYPDEHSITAKLIAFNMRK